METEPGNSLVYPRNEERSRDGRRKVVTGEARGRYLNGIEGAFRRGKRRTRIHATRLNYASPLLPQRRVASDRLRSRDVRAASNALANYLVNLRFRRLLWSAMFVSRIEKERREQRIRKRIARVS